MRRVTVSKAARPAAGFCGSRFGVRLDLGFGRAVDARPLPLAGVHHLGPEGHVPVVHGRALHGFHVRPGQGAEGNWLEGRDRKSVV